MRRSRVRRTRPDHLRPRHRAAELRRRARRRGPPRRLPRHRAAHPPPLGPHPGPAVLPAAGGGRRERHRDRSPSGGRAARHRVPPGDEPAVLPDHARGAARRRGVRVGRQRRLRAQRRQGAVAVGAPHRSHARLPGRDGGRVGRVPLRPRPRHRARRRRRLRAAATCSSSATASTSSSTTRSTPPRSTRSSARGVTAPIEYAIHVAKEAGARQLALFHHCPSHGDESLDTILRDARDFSARINGPEVFAAADGMRHELHSPR